MNTTSLLHEAYLKFARQGTLDLNDRGHFFAVAATVMRHLLIDYARKSRSASRGSGIKPETLEGVADPLQQSADDLIALDEALDNLTTVDERLARIVEMRFFGGMTGDEVAQYFSISDRTVKRDWRKAKALLFSLMAEPVPQ